MAFKNGATPKPDLPKLSLTAQFDDIVRCKNSLAIGVENEFMAFINGQDQNRIKWCDALKVIDGLKQEGINLRYQKDTFENKWKHMKALFEAEMLKRIKAEKEKRSVERQIALIKEVLLSDQNALNDQAKEKLAFLSTQNIVQDLSPRRLGTIEESMGSLLSPSDFSFDKTEEDLDYDDQPNEVRRTRSKRSFPEGTKAKAKKQRLHDESLEDVFSTNFHENRRENLNRDVYACVNRSCSEPMPSSETVTIPRQVCKSDDPLDGVLFIDEQIFPKSITGSTPLRRLSSVGKLNRNHVFCTKTIIRPESCFPCGRRIKFYKQALKCQDCRVVCHTECKEKVPLPCYPTMQTPTGKGILGTVADYAPSTPPFVPALMVHCINEIESRGLNEVGLYRVSGAEREVKELKEKFLRGKCLPCLSKIDVHAICGTVKEFLRSLYEPLITKALWQEFVSASELRAESEQLNAICQAINKLPQSNRDTLGFLLIHLNSVAESPRCKMPRENLAKIFGPTILGYSSRDPSNTELLSQTKYQCKVVHLLMKVQEGYWRSFVSATDEEIPTPETRAPPEGNRLGPISSSVTRSGVMRGVTISKVPYTPRGTITGSVKTRQRYFASPAFK